MRIRRHFTSLNEKGISFDRRRALTWLGLGVAAVLAGYVTAYLILFPAPILPGHQAVPRVLGLTIAEAQAEVQRSQLQMTDGGAEPHPTAPQGVIIWQDPPPGVTAPAGLRVTLVSSEGPPKIAVPDVTGLEAPLAQRLIAAAGLTAAAVESVQAAAPPGVVMLTRPAATTVLSPGAPVTIVVSRGGPTIAVPDLLGLSQADARTRLEPDGLQVGTVARRRTGA